MGRRYSILLMSIILSFSINLFPQHNNPLFQTPVFENISIEDGLPENSVTCILQDYLGYIWLGTQNGLVRYDGCSMKIFQPENMNQEMLRQKGIVALYEDTEKTLWICTLNGLYKYNRLDETFNCYKNIVNDKESISTDLLHCIYEDNKGRLWIGTQEGLSLFDRKKEKFTNYYFYLKKSEVITTSTPNKYNLSVNAIIENPVTGNLLIGTSFEGLWKFNCTNKTFSKYKFKDNLFDKKIGYIQSFNIFNDKKIWMASYHTLCSLNPKTGEFNSYIDFPVKKEERFWKPSFVNASIIKDCNGLIWCSFGAGGKGIFCLDPKTKYIQNNKPISVQHYDIYHNKIFAIYEDRSGIIWAGTWGTGLWKWDRRKNKFLTANRSLNSFEELKNFSATSFVYDSTGFIWFGSPRGLQKYDLKNGTFKNYLQSETCITQYDLYTMYIDKSGIIWLGTINCGLIRFNPVDGSYRYYFNNPSEPINLTNKLITNIYQDHLGFLWISTDGYGLYRFETVKYNLKQFKHDPNDPSSLSQNQPGKIFEDSFNTLWIGTNLGGLNKFDRNTEKFIYCGFRCITQIYEDKKGNFWVGDYFTGLNLFDRVKNKVIKCYNQQDGLATNSLWGILEDKYNNLWMDTNNGLLKFNSETNRFKRYSKADGLPDNFFSVIGHCMGPNETMLFNTDKGLVIFNPDSIKDDPTPPKVVISNVSLFNRPGEKLDIEEFISEIKELTIHYYKNDLRFEFVGLQFSEPKKNSYKYILENFDKDWVDAGNQRNATYTNLDPGEYVFRVNAANRDGVWSADDATIKIIILPPWWKTPLAYFFYVLIIFTLIYVTLKLQLRRIRIKQEYEMSKFETEKLHEVDELKTRFFANISHEFRTPLTLILGLVKQMIDETKENKSKEKLCIVHKNAKRLLNLVNQLLDIAKLESGNIKLKTSPQNIIPFLKAIVFSFTSYAERKNITLKFETGEEEFIVYLDREKIEKVVINVLSNAFKFTPEGGKITVKTESNDKFIIVSISDTGVGIPEEKISKIFNRFYQVDRTNTREYEGTGIGLAFTKELIEIHKGKIEVESVEGKGTTFKINIPLGKDHLKPEEIFINDDRKLQRIHTESILEEAVINNNFNSININGKPVLLIVEDNYDVRNFIKQNLENNFNIIEACNGQEGLEKSVNQIPDLIISDVMMPKLDGFKLCDKLKSDERTSHIPIILLTAKASSQDKINGYKIGADDYIMKPFESTELAERINNLIEQRKRIHNHFRKHGLLELDDSKVCNLDKEFLNKVINTISDNMSSELFGVELLAEKLFISRSLLHKKLVSLTGESPVELIRSIRLKKATQLMDKKFGNISQIAMEVGFNNSAYFTECFKKQFGISPSQYLHKINKN